MKYGGCAHVPCKRWHIPKVCLGARWPGRKGSWGRSCSSATCSVAGWHCWLHPSERKRVLSQLALLTATQQQALLLDSRQEREQKCPGSFLSSSIMKRPAFSRLSLVLAKGCLGSSCSRDFGGKTFFLPSVAHSTNVVSISLENSHWRNTPSYMKKYGELLPNPE